MLLIYLHHNIYVSLKRVYNADVTYNSEIKAYYHERIWLNGNLTKAKHTKSYFTLSHRHELEIKKI